MWLCYQTCQLLGVTRDYPVVFSLIMVNSKRKSAKNILGFQHPGLPWAFPKSLYNFSEYDRLVTHLVVGVFVPARAGQAAAAQVGPARPLLIAVAHPAHGAVSPCAPQVLPLLAFKICNSKIPSLTNLCFSEKDYQFFSLFLLAGENLRDSRVGFCGWSDQCFAWFHWLRITM